MKPKLATVAIVANLSIELGFIFSSTFGPDRVATDNALDVPTGSERIHSICHLFGRAISYLKHSMYIYKLN